MSLRIAVTGTLSLMFMMSTMQTRRFNRRIRHTFGGLAYASIEDDGRLDLQGEIF